MSYNTITLGDRISLRLSTQAQARLQREAAAAGITLSAHLREKLESREGDEFDKQFAQIALQLAQIEGKIDAREAAPVLARPTQPATPAHAASSSNDLVHEAALLLSATAPEGKVRMAAAEMKRQGLSNVSLEYVVYLARIMTQPEKMSRVEAELKQAGINPWKPQAAG